MTFHGSDYVPSRDRARLTSQLEAIRQVMSDGQFRTLGEIEQATGAPQASVSAQLRNLKKPRYGGYRLEKAYQGRGLYRYRLLPSVGSGQMEMAW